MGLLDSLIGGNSNSTTSGKQTAVADQNQTTKQEQAQTTTSSQNTTQEGVSQTSTLDADTVAFIKDLTGKLGSSSGGASPEVQSQIGQLQKLIGGLTERANNSPADLQAVIDANQGAAREQFGQTTGAQIKQAQQQTGSRFGNSFSQLLEQQGNISLDTSLAKIASDAYLQNKSQQSQDLNTVASLASAIPSLQTNAESVNTDTISSLLSILKGANTTSTQEASSTTDAINELKALLESNTTGQTTTKTSGGSGTSTGSGLLGMLGF